MFEHSSYDFIAGGMAGVIIGMALYKYLGMEPLWVFACVFFVLSLVIYAIPAYKERAKQKGEG